MEDTYQQRRLTIRGIVVPVEWSDQGLAIQVAILTPDEHQYVVSYDGAGKNLFHDLREEVEAQVFLDEAQGARLVTVLCYEVLHQCDSDDEYYHDICREPEEEW